MARQTMEALEIVIVIIVTALIGKQRVQLDENRSSCDLLMNVVNWGFTDCSGSLKRYEASYIYTSTGT